MSQGFVCAGSHTSVAALVNVPGHDTNNLVRAAANRQRAPDSRRVALEAPRPEPFADHRRAGSVCELFFVGEPSAGDRWHRVNSEEARRDASTFQPFRLRTARIRHVFGVAAGQCDEAVIQAVPLLDPARRDEAALLGADGLAS